MKNVLRALVVTGVMGVAAAAAQAQVGIYVGAGPAYVAAPPCPGPDYVWNAGYYAGSVWYPGRWMHREEYARFHRDYRYDYRYDRGRDYHYDRNDHRGWRR